MDILASATCVNSMGPLELDPGLDQCTQVASQDESAVITEPGAIILYSRSAHARRPATRHC